jgi:lipopolysaccharide/colanic/teichoic acid biosynthesis glycosyltransferase
MGDIIVSIAALILLSPLFLLLAILIKCDSKGPVFFRQERIGYHKKPFKIIKFRTMVNDAEINGPQLSSAGDVRITRIGHFMRKYRLDELPQFWNILCGEMSFVGPRPEREFYIKQILKKAPYYSLLHQVRPGLTSWGMVKHGYASTIDEMVERSRFDLIYLENISLIVDLKILLYTVNTVISGRGI